MIKARRTNHTCIGFQLFQDIELVWIQMGNDEPDNQELTIAWPSVMVLSLEPPKASPENNWIV